MDVQDGHLKKYGGGSKEQDAYLDEPAETYAEEEAREETDEERLETRQKCLRAYAATLMIMGGALCGGALYCSTLLLESTSQTLMYAVAGVGAAYFAVNIIGLSALCSKVVRKRILTTYFTFTTVLAFAMLIVGGFCLLMNKSAVAYVQRNWLTILSSVPVDKRAALSETATVQNIRIALYVTGGAGIAMFFLCLGAMSNTIALLTPSRAYTIFLQATNISLLPVGVALVAAAVFLADTGVSAEVAMAAFSIFVLGVFVVVLLLLGCLGTSLQSRGLVRLFMILTLLLGIGFNVFGILSLVQADLVVQFITSQWQTLRRVLPPDFGGKYDIEQFQKYVADNLSAVGFMAVVAGLILLSQFWASFRLRHELKFESELEQVAWEGVDNGTVPPDVAAAISRSHNKSRAQVVWKQQWTKGTKTSRRIILCGCSCLCLTVLGIISGAVAALYFSTNCTDLSSYSARTVYDTASLGPYVFVHSTYSQGTSTIAVDAQRATNDVHVSFHKSAYRESMANPVWPAIANKSITLVGVDALGGGNTTYTAQGLSTLSSAPTQLAGFDISCQVSDVSVSIPPAHTLYSSSGGGNTREAGDAAPLAFFLESTASSHSVDINWSGVEYVDRPRIRRLDARTFAGTIDLDGVLLGSKGALLSTVTGSITLRRTHVHCDSNDIGSAHGGLRLSSDKGSMLLSNVTTRDCDVVVSVNASLTEVQDSHISNSLGGGTLKLSGVKGVLSVARSVVQVVDIKGEEGSIRVRNCSVSEAIKVATLTGLVSLQDVRMDDRGVIQVETDTGNVDIWASRFRGIISVVTGGSVQCITSTADGFDDANPCTETVTAGTGDGSEQLRVVEQVSVNCKTATSNDCSYMGQITITSARGNVVLRMDKV